MESWKQALAELASDRLASLKRQAFLLSGDEGLAEDLVAGNCRAGAARTARPAQTGLG